jgi:RNA polymerase sigma-54 factor
MLFNGLNIGGVKMKGMHQYDPPSMDDVTKLEVNSYLLQCSSLDLMDYLTKIEDENPFIEVEEVYDSKSWQYIHAFYREVYDFASKRKVFKESLYQQLKEYKLDKREYQLGQYLIGELDDNGYLALNHLKVQQEFICSKEQLEKVLNIIKSFEPLGIGASSLKECLLLQIEYSNFTHREMAYELVNHFLLELEQGRDDEIKEALGLSPEIYQDIKNYIKRLCFKPGLIKTNDASPIFPDLLVSEEEQELNSYILEYHKPNLAFETYSLTLKNNGLYERLKEAEVIVCSYKIRYNILERLGRFCILNNLFQRRLEPCKIALREVAVTLHIPYDLLSHTIQNKIVQYKGQNLNLSDLFSHY